MGENLQKLITTVSQCFATLQDRILGSMKAEGKKNN